ncbi:hypothetical protein D3C75_334630 [compost metagenome]
MFAKDKDFIAMPFIQFGKEYSGQVATFEEDGFVLISVHKNKTYLATSYNGIAKAYSFDANAAILIEYLTIFKDYSKSAREFIQNLIYKEHSPTYDDLKDYYKNSGQPNFREMQTFSFCSNAEISISPDHLFFTAITGPSSQHSEGTVVGLSVAGASTVSLLPSYRVDVTKLLWEKPYRKDVLFSFEKFITDAKNVG